MPNEDTPEVAAAVPSAPEAYYVIQPTLMTGSRKRSATQAEAEALAARLLNADTKADKLFVVRVVSVVERPIPKADVRALKESDF